MPRGADGNREALSNQPSSSPQPKSNGNSSIGTLANLSASENASDNYAYITRAMYDDWLQRFYPQQKELTGLTQSNKLLTQQLKRVDDNYASSSIAAQQSAGNQMARFGVDAKEDKNSKAKTSLAKVVSKNSLRENEQDRTMSILSGSGKTTLSQIDTGS